MTFLCRLLWRVCCFTVLLCFGLNVFSGAGCCDCFAGVFFVVFASCCLVLAVVFVVVLFLCWCVLCVCWCLLFFCYLQNLPKGV